MTAGYLYELLDRLPERCDTFKVRFTLPERGFCVEPTGWHVDEYDNICLEVTEDGDQFPVRGLKRLLNGELNDDCVEQNETHSWQEVFVLNEDDGSEDYYYILEERFEINWKRNRVDVFMSYDNSDD